MSNNVIINQLICIESGLMVREFITGWVFCIENKNLTVKEAYSIWSEYNKGKSLYELRILVKSLLVYKD